MQVRYAGFWIRLLASFLDTLFLALPLGIIIYSLSDGEWFNLLELQESMQMAMHGNIHAVEKQPKTSLEWELLFEVSLLLITLLFWKIWRGATPGKRFVQIKIVDAKSFKEISNKQALTRSIAYIPSLLLFGVGFFMILFRRDKRSLHDLLAQSAVIYEQSTSHP